MVVSEDMVRKAFKVFDKNGDGFLDLAEVPRAESAFITYFDLDQDGTVSLEEFSGSAARFGRLDSDSNGVVTAAEVERSLNEEERSDSKKNNTRDGSKRSREASRKSRLDWRRAP